jgi:hypothetical protein
LNFFKWAIENNVLDYIETNYTEIENDMNSRNSANKRVDDISLGTIDSEVPKPIKNRNKRAELSISASKSIKKENIEITVSFD